MLDPNVILIVSILAAVGAVLFFVGSLFTVITALGNKQYIFGWAIFLCLPLSLPYCALNWGKAAYPGKMVFSGSALLLACFLVLLQQGGYWK